MVVHCFVSNIFKNIKTIKVMKKTIDAHLPFLSFSDTMEALDCSKSFLTNLVNSGKVKPKYLNSKPYFFIQDIVKAFDEKKSS